MLDRREEKRSAEFFSPKDNLFSVYPIRTFGDCVAIAPLAPETISEGGIVIPEVAQGIPDAGLVVGLPDKCDEFKIGDLVKFSPRHSVCSLTGCYSEYGEAQILVVRFSNVFALLPRVAVEIKE